MRKKPTIADVMREVRLIRKDIVRLRLMMAPRPPREANALILRIRQLVAEEFSVDERLLNVPNRYEHMVLPRHIAIALCHEIGVDKRELPEAFARDRKTIDHAIGEIRWKLGQNINGVGQRYAKLRDKLMALQVAA